jgi:hypothetical protein
MRWFVVILVALPLAAVLAIASSCYRWSHTEPHEQIEFQKLVGGLGFGPALNITPCAASFDPRVQSICTAHLGPIAGGVVLCPHHACSLFYYPATRGLGVQSDGEQIIDAQVP